MHRGLVILVVLAAAEAGRADVALPPPGPQRVAQADLVVVGRVVGLENQDLEVPIAPGRKEKRTYRIALVAVTEPILGGKLQMVRVGFQPPVEAQVKGGAIFRRPTHTPQLNVGLDGLLYLRKHPAGDFFYSGMYYDVVRRTEGNFAADLREAREAAGLLADPVKSLKHADEEMRFRAAALLLARYRIAGIVPSRLEPIPAEESRLILQALLKCRWKRPPVARGRIQSDPWSAFNMLGLTAKDGWTPPKGARSIDEYHLAAQAWLRRHGETYRIQRFARE